MLRISLGGGGLCSVVRVWMGLGSLCFLMPTTYYQLDWCPIGWRWDLYPGEMEFEEEE